MRTYDLTWLDLTSTMIMTKTCHMMCLGGFKEARRQEVWAMYWAMYWAMGSAPWAMEADCPDMITSNLKQIPS